MSEYVMFSEELLRNFYDPATCSYMVPLSGKAAHDMGVLREENVALKAENVKLKVENVRLRKVGHETCHITREPGSDRLWYCDNCKSYHDHQSDYAWEFCPRCGAKRADA